ncbi:MULTISPECIES: hypothetical protein [unclassified Caldicellulosiruptor]|uniref:hypothetical protein n=1 Tax=unclassified Caldicellulosiruptor TaxID=2622462 RepID=UPI00039A99B3|nr:MULTISPECIES: hypothetical protein [unclassified Caldicellulosiruptor]
MKKKFVKVLSLTLTLALICLFSHTISYALTSPVTVKLSDYKVYIDGVQLPVYSVNGNLMVNVFHLDYYGYKILSSENGVYCFRQLGESVVGVPRSKWNEKINTVNIKPKNWCILNGQQVPVLYLNKQPFIFLNELYRKNGVKMNGKRVDIVLGILDGEQKTSEYYDQLNFLLKILKNDTKIVEYTIAYAYYDPKKRKSYLGTSEDIDELFDEMEKNDYTLLQYYVLGCTYYDSDYDKQVYVFEDCVDLIKYYTTQEYINKLRFIFGLYQKANNNCPIYVNSTEVDTKTYNFPVAKIELFNLSLTPVDAIELSFSCLTIFGQPAKDSSGSMQYTGIKQNICIPALDNYMTLWDLSKYSSVGKISNVVIKRLHFIDDSIWINQKSTGGKSF